MSRKDVFGIEVVGKHELKVFIKNISVALGEAKKKISEDFARHSERKIKSTIYKQKFDVPPLTPQYLKWKTSHGLSNRILIATGQYVRSIKVKKMGSSWFLIVPPEKHADSDLLMSEIARILEFGSPARNIPARPIWAQTARALEKEYPKFARKFARKILNEIMGVNIGGGKGGKRWLSVIVEN